MHLRILAFNLIRPDPVVYGHEGTGEKVVRKILESGPTMRAVRQFVPPTKEHWLTIAVFSNHTLGYSCWHTAFKASRLYSCSCFCS